MKIPDLYMGGCGLQTRSFAFFHPRTYSVRAGIISPVLCKQKLRLKKAE